MRRIAIINQKGGVGKTTTTANLGAALAQAGQRVVIVDLDPQSHLTLHFGIEVGDDQSSIYDVLTSSTPIREALIEVSENISLLPADIDLAAAESELVSVAGREVILREAFETIDADFDVLLIDCPPSLGVLTLNALSAVGEVVIPLQAHFFGLQGLGKLFDTVTLVRQRINPSLVVSGVVLCMHEAATRLATEVVEDLVGFLDSARGTEAPWANARLFDTRIRRNIRLAEASSFGRTVFDYAPTSNGTVDYENLAAEVMALVESNGSCKTSQPTNARDSASSDVPPERSRVQRVVTSPGDVPQEESTASTRPLPKETQKEAKASLVRRVTKKATATRKTAQKAVVAEKTTAPKDKPPAKAAPASRASTRKATAATRSLKAATGRDETATVSPVSEPATRPVTKGRATRTANKAAVPSANKPVPQPAVVAAPSPNSVVQPATKVSVEPPPMPG